MESSRGARTFIPRKAVKLVAAVLWVLRTPYRRDQLMDMLHGYRHRLVLARKIAVKENDGRKPRFSEYAIHADQWLYRELTACVISAFGMSLGRLIMLIFRIGG